MLEKAGDRASWWLRQNSFTMATVLTQNSPNTPQRGACELGIVVHCRFPGERRHSSSSTADPDSPLPLRVTILKEGNLPIQRR